MSTARGMRIGPHILVRDDLVMGEDAAVGVAYEADQYGVLTKAGASSRQVYYLDKLAKNTEQVGGIVLSGGVPALIGVGGCSINDPLTPAVNGTLIVGTVGTDHIVAYASKAASAADVISVTKVA